MWQLWPRAAPCFAGVGGASGKLFFQRGEKLRRVIPCTREEPPVSHADVREPARPFPFGQFVLWEEQHNAQFVIAVQRGGLYQQGAQQTQRLGAVSHNAQNRRATQIAANGNAVHKAEFLCRLFRQAGVVVLLQHKANLRRYHLDAERFLPNARAQAQEVVIPGGFLPETAIHPGGKAQAMLRARVCVEPGVELCAGGVREPRFA